MEEVPGSIPGSALSLSNYHIGIPSSSGGPEGIFGVGGRAFGFGGGGAALGVGGRRLGFGGGGDALGFGGGAILGVGGKTEGGEEGALPEPLCKTKR